MKSQSAWLNTTLYCFRANTKCWFGYLFSTDLYPTFKLFQDPEGLICLHMNMAKKLQEWTKKHNWPVTTALWRPPQAIVRTQFPITLLICPSAVLLPFIADERSLLYSADSMHGIGWGEETVRILEPRPNCPSPPYPQPHTWPKSDASKKTLF